MAGEWTSEGVGAALLCSWVYRVLWAWPRRRGLQFRLCRGQAACSPFSPLLLICSESSSSEVDPQVGNRALAA